MANEVGIFGGVDLIGSDDDLKKQLAEHADVGARGSDDISYMSFSGKKGRYSIGTEGRQPGPDEPFLVAVPMFRIGWMCWKNGRPVAKRLAGPREPQIGEPDMNEFGPFGDGEGWSRARQMTARSLENGEQVEFTVSSKSGVASIADLHRQIREQSGVSDAIWPIIYFGSEEFEAGGYKNDKPVFEVIKWLSRADIVKWTGDFDPMTFVDEIKVEAPAPAPATRARRQL